MKVSSISLAFNCRKSTSLPYNNHSKSEVTFHGKTAAPKVYTENIGFGTQFLFREAKTIIDSKAQELEQRFSNFYKEIAKRAPFVLDAINPVLKLKASAFGYDLSFTRKVDENKPNYSLELNQDLETPKTIDFCDNKLVAKFDSQKELYGSLNEITHNSLTEIINKNANIEHSKRMSVIKAQILELQNICNELVNEDNNLAQKIEGLRKIVKSQRGDISRLRGEMNRVLDTLYTDKDEKKAANLMKAFDDLLFSIKGSMDPTITSGWLHQSLNSKPYIPDDEGWLIQSPGGRLPGPDLGDG